MSGPQAQERWARWTEFYGHIRRFHLILDNDTVACGNDPADRHERSYAVSPPVDLRCRTCERIAAQRRS